jgi:glycosyltransferase involved in cell wall biosynthesis
MNVNQVHRNEWETDSATPTVVVLIPCLNEEASIASVVDDFRAALPHARIYVYDNNSSDLTVERARSAGAIVRAESRAGKGNVVRRMFADVDADIYVLVDGDGTYDAATAPALIDELVTNALDMVCGARAATSHDAYRPGHRYGNAMLTGLAAYIFGGHLRDMLTGYRVLSRRFVKTFPALSEGFEIETELTIHALEQRLPMTELPTPYRERPRGSSSKLRTYRDGARIFATIFHLIKEEKPLQFFSAVFGVLVVTAVLLMTPIMITYYRTGLVPRFPTAILAASIILLAFLSLVCGLVLETVTRGRKESKRICYLVYPPAVALSGTSGARSEHTQKDGR